jgi:hypothetical protein
VIVSRASFQASLHRIQHPVVAVTPGQLVVGAVDTGHKRKPVARGGTLEELPEGAGHRLGFAGTVAEAVAESPLLGPESRGVSGDVEPVETRVGEVDQVSRRQVFAVGGYGICTLHSNIGSI